MSSICAFCTIDKKLWNVNDLQVRNLPFQTNAACFKNASPIILWVACQILALIMTNRNDDDCKPPPKYGQQQR